MHLTNVAIQKHAPGFDSAKVCVYVCMCACVRVVLKRGSTERLRRVAVVAEHGSFVKLKLGAFL
jgi:hypothetical protein